MTVASLATVTLSDSDQIARKVALFDERLRVDGTRIDADIEGRTVGARLIRTMDGASSLELDCWDHDLKLLRSGILTRHRSKAPTTVFARAAWQRFGLMRLTLDGARFRLAGVTGTYDASTRQITLVWEDEIASLMRRHQKRLKRSRGPSTRAEFIQRLARASQESRIFVESPELDDKQPIRGDSQRARDKARKKGIHPDKHLTVKGSRADSSQIRNMEIALTEADRQRAGDRATIAMLCAGIGESSFRAIMNTTGSGYGGVFQGDVAANYRYFTVGQTKEQAHYFLAGGKGFQQGGAIKLAAENPSISAGEIAYRVEGSLSNFSGPSAAEHHYGQWEDEAQAILDAWGGAGELQVIRRQFEFKTRGDNYWEAAGNLAREVRWRLFADSNELWYVSDNWLIQRRPTIVLSPDTDALRGFTFSADVGIPVSEIRAQASAPRWVGPPGSVVDVEDMGPLTGRWLLWENRLDLFTEEADLTLRRPQPKLPEPAADRDVVQLTESEPEAGSVRAEIVRAARRAKNHAGDYVYGQVRPMPSSLFKINNLSGGGPFGTGVLGPGQKIVTDCSGFATLCYKQAGAEDPNGRGYDGSGYTGTLAANGQKTSDPQPGDLIFYGSGPPWVHVAIYIGGGQAIGFGSNPIKQHAARYRSDFGEYRTYDV